MNTKPSVSVFRTTLLVLCCAATIALAQEGEEERKPWNFLEQQLTLDPGFESPHIKWAKPYSAGTVRVQFICPWFQGSTEPREIVELMERFDIDGRAAYLMGNRFVGDGHPDWYGNDAEAGTKRIAAFLNDKLDAVFVNQLTLEAVPEAIRDSIRERVAEGVGLVIVGEKAAAFDGAQPLTGVPGTGQYFTLGKGRIALLPSRAKLEYRVGWETEFDYQMEEQGRALLWAANRTPQAAVTIHVKDVDRAALPATCIAIDQSGLPEDAQVDLTLRRWDGVRTYLGNFPVITLPQQVSLPKVRAGTYHIDCIATTHDEVVTWATAPFTVSTTPAIGSLAVAKDWAEVGEQVDSTLTLTGSLPATARVEWRLVDKDTRILRRGDVPGVENGAHFQFTVESWMPALLRVEAVILDGEDDAASAYAFLRMTNRNRGQFNFVMWNAPTGDLATYGVRSMAKYGVTAFLQSGPAPLSFSENGLAYVPYAASFRASSHTITAMLDPETGLLKSGCVYDPAAMQKSVTAVVDGARAARGSGVLAYSLGDENAVRASCLGPECLHAYQQYLKATYGDIAALNREWDSDYAAFDDVRLLSEGPLPAPDAPEWFKEYFAERQLLHRTDSEGAKGDALERQVEFGNINDEMRALQAGNFARWYDRQAFQCKTYVEWCKQFQKAFREIDPQAWTGFEGTDSFSLRKLTTRSRQGGDLDAFVRELDYYGSYEGPGNEVMRSIAPKGFPMGSWIGYTPDVEELLFKYWQQVADRMNTIQWWRWDNLETYNGFLAPNLAPFPATRELFEDTQVVRDGLGALILESDMQDDAIAMLYSMPSTHIAHFDSNESYGLYTRDHDRWHKLLHDEGLQFRYVTDRMLRLGEFDPSRYKVLILPLAFAMGEKEAAAIRDFVERGGTVIADLRPALYDGHCKPLQQGLLNDVFGISQAGNRAARKIDRMAIDSELNGQKLAMRWGNWHGKDVYPQMEVDPNVAVTTGKAMGEAAFIHYWTSLNAPMCVVNEFGKGRAVLLNFSVFDAPCGGLLRGLLAGSGVMPAIRLTTPDGVPVKDVEISRWRTGEIEFFVALSSKYKGDVKLSLPAECEVYDVKDHKHLGRCAEFPATLRPNRAAVFALLPRVPEPVNIDCANSVMRGAVVYAKITIPHAAGAHAIRFSVAPPDGREAEWSTKVFVVAKDQSVSVALPFAFNDIANYWKMAATDLYTHESMAQMISVEK